MRAARADAPTRLVYHRAMTDAITPADMTLDELRPILIEALLPNVAFDGWRAELPL